MLLLKTSSACQPPCVGGGQGRSELRMMKQFTGLSVAFESGPVKQAVKKIGTKWIFIFLRCKMHSADVGQKKAGSSQSMLDSQGHEAGRVGKCVLWHYSQAVRWFKAALLLSPSLPSATPRLHCSPRTPPPPLLCCLHLSSPTSSLCARSPSSLSERSKAAPLLKRWQPPPPKLGFPSPQMNDPREKMCWGHFNVRPREREGLAHL